jgi:hypothetical protein
MGQWRKKPVVIDAVQVLNNEYGDNPLAFRETPEWLQEAFKSGAIVPKFRGEDYWYYDINTLEGTMTASPDDWIIRGTEGEFYPCKPAAFAATFEEVAPRATNYGALGHGGALAGSHGIGGGPTGPSVGGAAGVNVTIAPSGSLSVAEQVAAIASLGRRESMRYLRS